MTEIDDASAARTTHSEGSRRKITTNYGGGMFLRIEHLRGQGRQNHHRLKQQQRTSNRRPSATLWVLIVGCLVLLRLMAETGLLRNLLTPTENERLRLRLGENEDYVYSPARTDHKVVMSPSSCDENDECGPSKTYSNATSTTTTLRNRRPSMGEETKTATATVFSGSTFRVVPSATNLLFSSQEQHHSSCYDETTRRGDVFHDKSIEDDHDYSDSNYALHVLGSGGICHQDGFGVRFPRDASSSSSKNIIVTAYYEIPSKHPPDKYHEWMGNFLSVYRDPMVIFTSPNLVDMLANLRRHHQRNSYAERKEQEQPSLYFDTIIVAIPLDELPLANLYTKSFWVDQLDRDPQSSIHSPLRGDPRMQGRFESGELYWIWLSKIWFVKEATRIFDANVDVKTSSSSIQYEFESEDPTREQPSMIASGGFSNSEKEAINNNNSNKTYDRDDDDNDVFAWIDIGSFRNEDPTAKNNDTPSPLLLRHPEVVPATEMLFWSHSSAHSYYSPPEPLSKSNTNANTSNSISTTITTDHRATKRYAPIPPRESPYFDDKSLEGGRYFFHSGAHFAGRPTAISRYYHQFLHTMDVFVERNMTLADDQAVMQSACLSYYYDYCAGSHRHGDNGDNNNNNNNSIEQHGCDDKRPKHNLCAYATRDMVGGKSKWFGLTKLLQTGWAAGIITNTPDDPRDLYWKPPPPEYYKK